MSTTSSVFQPTTTAQNISEYYTPVFSPRKFIKPTDYSVSKVTIATQGNSDYYAPPVPQKTFTRSTSNLTPPSSAKMRGNLPSK